MSQLLDRLDPFPSGCDDLTWPNHELEYTLTRSRDIKEAEHSNALGTRCHCNKLAPLFMPSSRGNGKATWLAKPRHPFRQVAILPVRLNRGQRVLESL
jgi:hypothetical protein